MSVMPERARCSYLSPKFEARRTPGKGGWGVLAVEPAQSGELVAVWGGHVLTAQAFQRLPEALQRHSVQVEEGLYLTCLAEAEPADYINHSCEPNCGMLGQIAVVAMRDIQTGEEACIDYAMCDGSPYDEFDCSCGTPSCRGRINGEDWRIPELQSRYRGHFSPYLWRRIEAESPA